MSNDRKLQCTINYNKMKKVKLKFFHAPLANAENVSDIFQEKVDSWQKRHPDFQIQKSELKSVPVEISSAGYSRGGGMVLCLEYYKKDISNRKLITENEN